MGWGFLNKDRIDAELAVEPEPVRQIVSDAAALLLCDPYDPPGVDAHELKGDGRGLWVAYLPNDWYITYQAFPQGLPPLAAPLIVIYAMNKLNV